ncbi:MAG: DNA-processing protein DprA [Myxococcota bacterium]|nr:DNA-processing protein DprA [Myxococcota bacterium]
MQEHSEQTALFACEPRQKQPTPGAVSARERAARWGIWTIEGIGFHRLSRLLEITDGALAGLFDDPLYAATVSAQAALPQHVLSPLARLLEQDPLCILEQELELLGEDGELLMIGDAGYPPGLLDLEDPPYFVSVRGASSALWLPRRLAMVGSRDVPAAHELFATRLAGELAAAGCVIVSGGALGMDAASHRGALAAKGLTAVVLPGGFGHPSPGRHRRLFEQVVERGGVLITEYPYEVSPKRYHFPRRNRLIAALCQACVVLRAQLGGGTMLTADACRALSRPICALPYEAMDNGAKGTMELLRSGRAQLVMDAADVLESAFGEVAPAPAPSPLDTGEDGVEPIIAMLSNAPRGVLEVDELCSKLGARTSEVLEHLMVLELEGKIWRVPGAPAYKLAP